MTGPKVLNTKAPLNTPRHVQVRPFEYVGRPTKWGNPFTIGRDGTREEVIARYREMLDANPALREAAKKELRGKDLVCWCAPKACHADILLEVANS